MSHELRRHEASDCSAQAHDLARSARAGSGPCVDGWRACSVQDCLEMQDIGSGAAGLPAATRLIPGPLVQRQACTVTESRLCCALRPLQQAQI